jgi:hypothetical protein
MKKRRRKPPEELPLDDPRWIRIADLHRALAVRLGNTLAASDITKKLEKGDLPCMRRRISDDYPPGPERELVQKGFWGGYRVNDSSRFGATVVNRGSSFATERWYEYFVWKPVLEKVWPVLASAPTAAAPSEQADDTTSRRPPGPRPTKEWETHVEREIIRRGIGNMTAGDWCQFCGDTLDHQPDESDMRKLLRRLRNK